MTPDAEGKSLDCLRITPENVCLQGPVFCDGRSTLCRRGTSGSARLHAALLKSDFLRPTIYISPI